MEIVTATERQTLLGPAEWFTGSVWLEQLTGGDGPEAPRLLAVHFAPGARTAWHSHPAGQVLHVVAGRGRVGTETGEVVKLHAGDTVRAAPDERHWHGAAPDSVLVHLAMQAGEATWFEHVGDDEYTHVGAPEQLP
jgi:quercetin dioxygenase-like cupin family protein